MTLDPSSIAGYEAARNLVGKSFRSACYAPYTSLYFNTNGDVVACCKNTSYVLGNIADEGLEQIWRGKKAQAMRKAVRDYKLGIGCDFCEWQIKGGQYDQVYATTFDQLPASEGAEWPAMMEFTLSNTCNLACIMCYGVLSSTIRAHREKLPPLPRVYGDAFFADLRKFLPHLKIAKFFGGEPFLGQENFRVWDMMIEDGIQIPCHITTNATTWNKKVEAVLQALPCVIHVSLDGTTKQTVESIRVNTVHEVLLENVERFLAYSRTRPGAGMSLTYCLMRQNWHEFGEYLKFGEQRALSVYINTVIDPPDCSLYTLPADELKAIAQKMEEQDRAHGYSALPRNGRVWTSAIQALQKNATDRQREGIAEFRQAGIERNPLGRAWILVGEQKFDEALKVVSKVPEQDSQYYSRLVLEGHVYRRTDRLPQAAQSLARAIELFPRGPDAYGEQAWMYLQQAQTEAAMAAAEQGVKALRGDLGHAVAAPLHSVLGLARAHAGRFPAALEAADIAVQLKPADAWTHVHRGWVLLGASKVPEAIAAARRAIELQPDNGEAARIIAMAEARRGS